MNTANLHLTMVQVNPLGLESGCRARIHGLVSAPQHNGKGGTLLRFDEETLRWGIKIGEKPFGEEFLSVKPANLLRQTRKTYGRTTTDNHKLQELVDPSERNGDIHCQRQLEHHVIL